METNTLLAGIQKHVENLFATMAKPYLLYHNLTHTKNVVAHAAEIAVHSSLSEEPLFILLAAAWFHDTGQLVGNMYVHEEASVQLMQNYLSTQNTTEEIRTAVAQCIMATKMPVHPESLIEKILCDADTFHVGTPDFRKMDNLVWLELELRLDKTFDHKAERTLLFLGKHTWYTSYCRQLLEAGKQYNIEQLKKDCL